MMDLLNSKKELESLVNWCTLNYEKGSKNSSFSFNEPSPDPEETLFENVKTIPVIIGSDNIKITSDILARSLSAITYKIGTLAENLNTKLDQISENITLLEEDVMCVHRQIHHAIEEGYQREAREAFGKKYKEQNVEKYVIDQRKAAFYESCSSKYERKPIDFDSLDSITTIKNIKNVEAARCRESFKDAYQNIPRQDSISCMSIRSSVSHADKIGAGGSAFGLKKANIPLIPFEIQKEKQVSDPLEESYANLDVLGDCADGFDMLDKLLKDMSKETEILETEYNKVDRCSLPPPPPPTIQQSSEYTILAPDSDDETMPPAPEYCEISGSL